MKTIKTIALIAGALLLASPVFAQSVNTTLDVSGSAQTSAGGTSGSASVDAATEARITTGKSRADQEINRRVSMLNDLNTKVQAMTRVSASEKNSISVEVQNETSNLTALQAKIDADTDITTLKADIKSITDSYRIFILVIPQGRIEVAADKIGTVATSLTTFAGKLQTRISDAQAAGKDVTTVSASLSDMNAKIADSQTQASAAVSLVTNLTPDNGNTTIMNANDAALKSARADLMTALNDLKAARTDAGSIVTTLKGWGDVQSSTSVSGSASSSSTSQ